MPAWMPVYAVAAHGCSLSSGDKQPFDMAWEHVMSGLSHQLLHEAHHQKAVIKTFSEMPRLQQEMSNWRATARRFKLDSPFQTCLHLDAACKQYCNCCQK